MTHHFDEFSKSLAEKAVPRRQTLRLLGAAFAGALLSPLGLKSAWAGGTDPCKAFCNQCPKSQRTQCLAACHACNGDTNRICGACGSHVCCDQPGPYEYGACVNGQCQYWCVDGAADCGDGACTPLWADPNNCGACGNVCPESAPACISGVCRASPCPPGLTWCQDSYCADLQNDSGNCGACGVLCGQFENCTGGVCQPN